MRSRRPHPDAAARLVAPCLRACAEAARQLAAEGWPSRPEWASCARGADSPAAEGELGLGNPGWHRHAVLALHTSLRTRVLLPALAQAACALLHPPIRSARWYDPTAPDMAVGLRSMHTGSPACPRTGLLPRRGFVVEGAWVRVTCEAVGPEGRVVPRQWLSRTTTPQVHPDDRRRLDFVVYTQSHTLPRVDPRRASRTRSFPAEVEGRWCDDCQQFLRTLLRLRVHRAPPPSGGLPTARCRAG